MTVSSHRSVARGLSDDPWAPLLCGLFLYAAILVGWRHNAFLFTLLALGSVALVASQPTRRNVIVWLLGMLSGIFAAYWRVERGIWIFASPNWGGVPVWIVWVFGTIMLSVVRLAEWIHDRLEPLLASRRGLRITFSGVGLALVVGSGVVMIRTLPPLFDWMAVVIGLIVLACRPGRRHLILFWIAALVGLVGEASGLAAGIYAYPMSLSARWDLVVTLQFGWGLSGVLLYGLSELAARLWQSPASPGSLSSTSIRRRP